MPKLVYQVTTNQQRGNPELAWQAPYQIAERLGSFEFDRLSRYHPIAVLGGHFILIRAAVLLEKASWSLKSRQTNPSIQHLRARQVT